MTTNNPNHVKGVQCFSCKDAIWSRHRHDFRKCSCGKTFVDGGRDYLRCGGEVLPGSVTIDTATGCIVDEAQTTQDEGSDTEHCHKDNKEGLSGIQEITEERERQITQEGWTAKHDDQHNKEELIQAASAYLCHCKWSIYNKRIGNNHVPSFPSEWPFEESNFKPDPNDPIKTLKKAGALIAAEIDRLKRQKSNSTLPDPGSIVEELESRAESSESYTFPDPNSALDLQAASTITKLKDELENYKKCSSIEHCWDYRDGEWVKVPVYIGMEVWWTNLITANEPAFVRQVGSGWIKANNDSVPDSLRSDHWWVRSEQAYASREAANKALELNKKRGLR